MWFLCRCWELRADTQRARRGDLKLSWQRSPCLPVISLQAQQGEQSKRQEVWQVLCLSVEAQDEVQA